MVGVLGLMSWFLSLEEFALRSRGPSGAARIRYGSTGPSGRLYSAAVTKQGRPHVTVVVKNRFVKAGKGARGAIGRFVKYIQERERAPEEPVRTFFNGSASGIEQDEVLQNMLMNQSKKVAMHMLLLSPGDNSLDMEAYARESMEALEKRYGHKLNWYGTVHENTKHHHVHIVIAGKVPERERFIAPSNDGKSPSVVPRRNRKLTWKKEEVEIRELIGHRYDEEAVKDPREERKEARRFEDKREPVDPKDRDVIPGNVRSVNELMAEKQLDKYDRQRANKQRAISCGEVYIDVNDLRELRNAGNDFKHREKSLDYSMEIAIEREFGGASGKEREIGIDAALLKALMSGFDRRGMTEKKRSLEKRRDPSDRTPDKDKDIDEMGMY